MHYFRHHPLCYNRHKCNSQQLLSKLLVELDFGCLLWYQLRHCGLTFCPVGNSFNNTKMNCTIEFYIIYCIYRLLFSVNVVRARIYKDINNLFKLMFCHLQIVYSIWKLIRINFNFFLILFSTICNLIKVIISLLTSCLHSTLYTWGWAFMIQSK